MMRFPAAFALFFMAFLVPAHAADADGRYTMSPSGDGFVRFDSETGVVSLCREENGALACKAAADDTARLGAEIERLKAENLALKEELDHLREAGAVAAPEPRLPSDAEIDRAMTFVEKLVRRFKALVDDLHRQDGQGTPL